MPPSHETLVTHHRVVNRISPLSPYFLGDATFSHVDSVSPLLPLELSGK